MIGERGVIHLIRGEGVNFLAGTPPCVEGRGFGWLAAGSDSRERVGRVQALRGCAALEQLHERGNGRTADLHEALGRLAADDLVVEAVDESGYGLGRGGADAAHCRRRHPADAIVSIGERVDQRTHGGRRAGSEVGEREERLRRSTGSEPLSDSMSVGARAVPSPSTGPSRGVSAWPAVRAQPAPAGRCRRGLSAAAGPASGRAGPRAAARRRAP